MRIWSSLSIIIIFLYAFKVYGLQPFDTAEPATANGQNAGWPDLDHDLSTIDFSQPFLLFGLDRPPVAFQTENEKTVAVRNPRKIIADSLESMGGKNLFDQIRVIQYAFEIVQDDRYLVRRLHLWDRKDGHYRLEDRTVGDHPIFVLSNVNRFDGDVYVDRRPVEDQAQIRQALIKAEVARISDGYWLTLPWLLDSGGHELTYRGTQDCAGSVCDVVEVRFAEKGFRPAESLYAYYSRNSGLLVETLFLNDDTIDASWRWRYENVGNLKLASSRVSPNGDEIRTWPITLGYSSRSTPAFTDPNVELEYRY